MTYLYAFRFEVNGRRYAWHQLQGLVDYPVTLTETQPGVYAEPERDAAILTLREAWLGCCVVWLFLLVHGRFPRLILFDAARGYWRVRFIRMRQALRDGWESLRERVFPHPIILTPEDDDDFPF